LNTQPMSATEWRAPSHEWAWRPGMLNA
jgi:hypothetical protein